MKEILLFKALMLKNLPFLQDSKIKFYSMILTQLELKMLLMRYQFDQVSPLYPP